MRCACAMQSSEAYSPRVPDTVLSADARHSETTTSRATVMIEGDFLNKTGSVARRGNVSNATREEYRRAVATVASYSLRAYLGIKISTVDTIFTRYVSFLTALQSSKVQGTAKLLLTKVSKFLLQLLSI